MSSDSPLVDALISGLRRRVEIGALRYDQALSTLIAAGLTFAEAVQALEDTP